MKLTKDKYASYIQLVDSIGKGQVSKTKEIAPNVYADYNELGQLIGIEILGNLEIEKIVNKIPSNVSNKSEVLVDTYNEFDDTDFYD